VTDSVTYSRPYAEAAYKIAVETNELDMWTDNLSILSRIIISGDVKAIIASPKIDPNKTLDFLNSFLTKENQMFSKFISIMIENKKVYFLDEVYRLFSEMILDEQNTTIAEVETAYPLTDNQKILLIKNLEKQHDTKIKIDEVINKELLAGIKISINNEVTDYSVRYKLNSMKEQIINNR
jgi:F-type H+-transporting ATPase subunit delta